MPECVHCGGSGILNIEFIHDRGEWHDTKYVTTCHACEMGALMAEVGVDG